MKEKQKTIKEGRKGRWLFNSSLDPDVKSVMVSLITEP